MWERGWVKAAMCCGQESKVGESWSRAVWVELSEEGSLEGERTRLGLASITPACPWSFHTAQNKRDLLPHDRRAAPVTAKGAIALPDQPLPAPSTLTATTRLDAVVNLCIRLTSQGCGHTAGTYYDAGCPTGHAWDDSYKDSTLPRGLGIASVP